MYLFLRHALCLPGFPVTDFRRRARPRRLQRRFRSGIAPDSLSFPRGYRICRYAKGDTRNDIQFNKKLPQKRSVVNAHYAIIFSKRDTHGCYLLLSRVNHPLARLQESSGPHRIIEGGICLWREVHWGLPHFRHCPSLINQEWGAQQPFDATKRIPSVISVGPVPGLHNP